MKRSLLSGLLSLLLCAAAQGQDMDAYDHYVQAEQFAKQRKWEDALVHYEKATEKAPENYKFMYRKGRCLLSMSKVVKAIACFERTIELKPEYDKPYISLAYIYRERKDYRKVVQYLEKAAEYEKDPERQLDYKRNIIFFLAKLDAFQEAGPHIADAKELSPEDPNVLYLDARYNNVIAQNYEMARKSMERAISLLQPGLPAERAARYYYELGYAHHHMGDYDAAAAAFKKASFGKYKYLITEMTPEYYYRMALSYYKIFNYEHAKQLLEEALKIDGKFIAAYDLLIEIEEAQLDRTSVIAIHKQSMEADSDPYRRVDEYRILCELYLEGGKLDKTITACDEVLAVHPMETHVNFLKAIALIKSNRLIDAKKVLLELDSYIAMDNEIRARNKFVLGLVYKKLGEREEAAKAFRAAFSGSFKYAANAELRDISEMDPSGSEGISSTGDSIDAMMASDD